MLNKKIILTSTLIIMFCSVVQCLGEQSAKGDTTHEYPIGTSLSTDNKCKTINSIKIKVEISSKEAEKLKLTEKEIFIAVNKQFHRAGIAILNEEEYELDNKPGRLKIIITNIRVYEKVKNNGYINCSINKDLFQYDRTTKQVIICSYGSSGISVGIKGAKKYIKNSIKESIKEIIENFCIEK